VNALGGEQACSELTMVAARRAVELTVTAEMTRAAVLTGCLKGLVIADLIKLENAARRAQAGLGLKIEPAKTAPRGLQRARERWAAQEQQAKAAQTARRRSCARGLGFFDKYLGLLVAADRIRNERPSEPKRTRVGRPPELGRTGDAFSSIFVPFIG
jgi:hypothetical protein